MPKQDICSESAMNAIFKQVAPQLRNYLYYKCKDLERSEDLVQDAFSKLWEKCKDVVPEAAKSFLYRVANNKLINMARHDQVRMKFAAEQEESLEYQNPEFQMEYKEFQVQLQEAIDALPDGQREAFLMHRIDKMTYKEIADTLGVSVKAIEKRMHQALLKLNVLLKGRV